MLGFGIGAKLKGGFQFGGFHLKPSKERDFLSKFESKASVNN